MRGENTKWAGAVNPPRGDTKPLKGKGTGPKKRGSREGFSEKNTSSSSSHRVGNPAQQMRTVGRKRKCKPPADLTTRNPELT